MEGRFCANRANLSILNHLDQVEWSKQGKFPGLSRRFTKKALLSIVEGSAVYRAILKAFQLRRPVEGPALFCKPETSEKARSKPGPSRAFC
ncbi:MAG: hypothetical protein D3923_02975 [Candidatus Electrothrix sp. AR3]|nr:hypothetical protein [Candidatus Electrothrix sp. AR3]